MRPSPAGAFLPTPRTPTTPHLELEATGRLTGAARERGIRVRVLEPGEDARLAALEVVESGARALGVAGGDGSVAAVVGVAAERGLPLVVVPTGTLNHFARDLGLDLAHPLRASTRSTPPTSGAWTSGGSTGARSSTTSRSGSTQRFWVIRATGKTSCAWRKRGSKPHSSTLSSDERFVSRHPTRRRSRASSPWSSRTTHTSTHGGTGSANATV